MTRKEHCIRNYRKEERDKAKRDKKQDLHGTATS